MWIQAMYTCHRLIFCGFAVLNRENLFIREKYFFVEAMSEMINHLPTSFQPFFLVFGL